MQLGYGARQRRLLYTALTPNTPLTEHAAAQRGLLSGLLACAGLACAEAPVTGAHYRVLVAARRVLAALHWQPRRGGNGAGPTVTDVSGLIHEEVRTRVLDAVRVLGLKTAEVRLATTNITQPLESQGGPISEVIAAPTLDLYVECVRSCPIAAAFLETLYRPGETGRIPYRGRLQHQR